jgi:hypothetical protein
MEWIIPLAIVVAAAWAVRWQFRDVEGPRRTVGHTIDFQEERRRDQQRRAA